MKNGKEARKKAIQIHFPKVITLGNWIPVEVRCVKQLEYF